MNLELTHQNHFKFGYDHNWYSMRENSEQRWMVEYGRCQKNPSTFKEACLGAARQISKNAGRKITVLFSGGIDSEVTLQSFLLAKIPVRAAILRFKNDLNLFDIAYAIIACERMNIKYDIFELDILKFWENELLHYANPTYCISPQLLSTMWLVDQIDEYPVIGSGECLLVKDYDDNYLPGISTYTHTEWSLWEKEKIAAWYRHFIVKNRDGCPGFFQYTPEIILSYLNDSFVQKITRSEIIGKLSTESSKSAIYQQHFNLIEREKYTGFEKIQDKDAYYRRILTEKFSNASQIYKTKVSDLVSSMTFKEE